MSSLRMLLAQRHNWERLGDRFSGKQAEIDTGEIVTLLLCLAGAAAAIWLLRVAAKWQEGYAGRPNPKRLFRELCRAHRLNRWERRVLQALAEASSVRQPAEVFVRPDAFRSTRPLPEAEEKPVAFEQLRKKLFPELVES